MMVAAEGEQGARKRLGEILVAEGIVTEAQVEEALALQRESSDFVGQILVRIGHLDADTLRSCLLKQYLANYRNS